MTMLSPFPKSTVISPGIPRNARMTSRCSLSVTGQILEELPECLRSVGLFLLQNLLETKGELRREIIQCFEQRLNELLGARTVHGQVSSPPVKRGEMPPQGKSQSYRASIVQEFGRKEGCLRFALQFTLLTTRSQQIG